MRKDERMRRFLCLACSLLLLLTCVAQAESTPRIAASNYALTFAVEQVCGHDWTIETVNPEGKADFMPNDAQMEALRACDLVVVFGTEAWVSELDEARVLKVGDALTGVNPDAGEGFWLAPINMALVGYTVSDALAALDPDCAKEIANHNELFVQAMIDLDNTLRAHIVRNQTIRVRGENGGDVSVFAAEYGLTYAPDDARAIELDPIIAEANETYIDRMLKNAERLH